MNYKLCKLYGLQSKKKLKELLHIEKKTHCKSSFSNSNITPFITGKGRLVEAPSAQLKVVQSRILHFLQKLDFPFYVYSGVKGKSYIDNAREHEGTKSIFKIDISKFFPNTSRDSIYRFFKDKLKMSSDVAEILSNYCAYNVSTTKKQNIKNYIANKGIVQDNHLITGSPVSSVMSYLANIDMFDKLYEMASKYNIKMTIYIDDVVFSSYNRIPYYFRKNVLNIIRSFGFTVAQKKCHWYKQGEIKKVTGVILDKNQRIKVPFKLMKKTHGFVDEFKCGDTTNAKRLMGCINTVEQIRQEQVKYKSLMQSKINKE